MTASCCRPEEPGRRTTAVPRAALRVLRASGIIVLVVVAANCCCNHAPLPPQVTILPATPSESAFQTQYDTFRLVAHAQTTDPDRDAVSFSFQWYGNEVPIQGASDSVLSASQIGRPGHTVRGYPFRCRVTASDGHGGTSSSNATIAFCGPTFNGARGCLFHNIFRIYALNQAGNSSLDSMKVHTHCDWVSIGIIYFQADTAATSIYEKTSTSKEVPSTIQESDLVSQIQHAHSLGLKVMVYPEIWIDGTVAVGPRNQISGSPEWFAEYQARIEHLADIAQANGVELFCVGVELSGTKDKEANWRQLIADVRQHYSGQVTYSAQYYPGIIDAVNWWDALDYVGSSSLFENPNGGLDPTVADLDSAYLGYRDVIQGVCTRFDKPLLVTEASAFSLDGCTKWGSQVVNHSTTQDLQEQADYYEAMFETFVGLPQSAGFWAEDWFPTNETWYGQDASWPTNGSFLNKPAEKVIRSWYG